MDKMSVQKPIPFVVRDPDYYRHVACREADVELICACLLLAADDIDRWRSYARDNLPVRPQA